MSEELICGSCGHPPHPKHGCPWPSNNAERIHCGCSADHSAYPTVQKQLADLRQRLATAEASAAAVAAQVREEARMAQCVGCADNLPYNDEKRAHFVAACYREGESAHWEACTASRIHALPLPSGAEALAARERATAERALREGWRNLRQGSEQGAWITETLAALFPVSEANRSPASVSTLNKEPPDGHA